MTSRLQDLIKTNRKKHTNVLFRVMMIIYVSNCHVGCVDSIQVSESLNFENVYLKFQTEIELQYNHYGIQIYLPYNFIVSVSESVNKFTSYLHLSESDQKIIITIQRKEYNQSKITYEHINGTEDDDETLQELNDCIIDLVMKLSIHIDSYIVKLILQDTSLNKDIPKLNSIKGIWEQDLHYPDKDLEFLEFKGIYSVDTFKSNNNYNGLTALILFLPFSEDTKEIEMEGNIKFEISYNLLEVVHKDLFKNTNLVFYKYKLETIIDQLSDRIIYIHKKCLNILRLYSNEEKYYNIGTFVATPYYLYVPFMCFFNVLGKVRNHFKALITSIDFKPDFDSLSMNILKYLNLVLDNNERESTFVGVARNIWFLMVKGILDEQQLDIHSCKVIYVKGLKILNEDEYKEIYNKIQKAILVIAKSMVKENDSILKLIKDC